MFLRPAAKSRPKCFARMVLPWTSPKCRTISRPGTLSMFVSITRPPLQAHAAGFDSAAEQSGEYFLAAIPEELPSVGLPEVLEAALGVEVAGFDERIVPG